MSRTVKWIVGTAVLAVAGVGVALLMDVRSSATEEEAPLFAVPGLVEQDIAGLSLLSPGALAPAEDVPQTSDTTIVSREDFTASGLGVILTLTRLQHAPGTAPFLDDVVGRAVAAVQSSVARPDGSDSFTYEATRVGVSGRYAIRIRATYNEPVGGIEQWTEALFFQEFDHIWQVQVVGSTGEGPESARAASAILDSVEIVS